MAHALHGMVQIPRLFLRPRQGVIGVNVGRGVNVMLGVNVIVGVAVGSAVGRRVGGGFWTAGLCEIAEIFVVDTTVQVGRGPSPAPKSVVK